MVNDGHFMWALGSGVHPLFYVELPQRQTLSHLAVKCVGL